jgi:hypothetical protein
VTKRVFAQAGPRLLEINGFIAKGAFTELDPEVVKHRLSLREIEETHLDGKATTIQDVLGLMARYEKLRARVAEPLIVRGQIPVILPPNTMGDEAYTACFYAFNFNGLVLAGSGDELILVRPETRNLPRPDRPWNRDQVLATQLFRLGYLKPDPIMRQYRDNLGTRAGRAVLEKKSNVLLVTDAAEGLDRLREYIDSEILEAMGVAAGDDQARQANPRPPSIGAIAMPAGIHFYLMAYARSRRIALVAAEEKGVIAKHYPEADLWTSEEGYRALQNEYRRLGEYVRLARENDGLGWDEPDPDRTYSGAEQNRLAIRYGVIGQSTNRSVPKNKKTKSVRKR